MHVYICVCVVFLYLQEFLVIRQGQIVGAPLPTIASYQSSSDRGVTGGEESRGDRDELRFGCRRLLKEN